MKTTPEITSLLEACAADRCLTPVEARLVLSKQLRGELLQTVLLAADRRMRVISGNRARLYATIGVDATPCARSCGFCSHGAQWGVYPDSYELTPEQVCALAAKMGAFEPDWFTLRTTQDYGNERLCELVRAVRRVLPARTQVVVNTGEFDLAGARALSSAGVSCAYHTFRLREGEDTGIAASDRLETLRIIQESGLNLFALVEPLGPEHRDEEIVEAAFRLKQFDVALSGCMARVPVAGTPLARHGKVSDERVVRTVALTRLISGSEVAAICVHPPLPAALRAGANTMVVECGAVPRAEQPGQAVWRGFDFAAAGKLFTEAGYETLAPWCASQPAEEAPCCDK